MCPFKHKIPTIWTTYETKHKKTPQTRAKSNIVRNFVVRKDEKVARRINATPDVTTRLPCIDGLWRGERKCIDPKAGDADLWTKIWEELHLLTSKEILVEVEHVKAHRTKKDKKDMSHVEAACGQFSLLGGGMPKERWSFVEKKGC